ncbi:MAG: hypothetical protein AB2L14_34900 [Candidatus Xenobiia bacterium LiM19]
MNSIGNSPAVPQTRNAASIILGKKDDNSSQEAKSLDFAVKISEQKLDELEKKGNDLYAMSKKIQAESAKESSKRRNILIGAGLIALGGVAAAAGAAAIPIAFLIKPIVLAALGGEAAMLISFNKSHKMGGALESEKMSLGIRLEENSFQRSRQQKKLEEFRQSLDKVKEEDIKKLNEALKNMPAQSIDLLNVEDTGDFIIIAGMKLRKKS